MNNYFFCFIELGELLFSTETKTYVLKSPKEVDDLVIAYKEKTGLSYVCYKTDVGYNGNILLRPKGAL